MATYFNTSEDDLQEDFKSDDYFNGISDFYIFYIFTLVFALITIILALVVISADIFLICVICRFKRLRTRTNMYILNCSILNILYLISLPILSILAEYFRDFFMCARVALLNVFLILYIVFAFALALDWFLSGYIPNKMEKYNKFYKYVFTGVYTIFIIESAVAVTICYESHSITRYYIFNALYIISLIVVVVLNILAKKVTLKNNSFKTAYSLTVANIILFSFLPFPIIDILSHLLINDNYVIGYIMMYVDFIPILTALLHPILVVYMLGKVDKYFKMAYKRSFKRSVKSYADENLDDGSDVENNVGYCGVKVNYLYESEQKPKIMIDA